MNQPSTDSEKQKRLNAILAEYVRRKEAGQPVSAAALLQAYPDLAEALRSYFQKEAADGNLASAQTIPPKRQPPPIQSNVRETMNPGKGRSDTASDLQGRTFGRYQLLRPLGDGAMGSVYLALDTTLDRRVALKMPKADGSAGEDFMARFTREAKAAAGLKHPHICSVYDAGKHDGVPYITMDYIDGFPLSQFIGTQQLQSIDSILQIVTTIANAVGHAHSNGVIHRDLKPGNIIVDSEFQPHVTDFGLARRIGPSNESRMTQEGLLIGTPAYMAPEQVKGEQAKVGRTSDIYSLGVILFELLTARLPFEGSVPEMLAKVLRDAPPIPSRLRKDLTEEVDDLCLKMLRKDPDRRFASMAEVIAAIEQTRRNLGKAPNRPDGTARQRSPFEIQKAHLEEMLKRGQYAAAIQDLENLAQAKQVGAKAVAEWARTKLPIVRAEAKALTPAALEALLTTAQQLFEKHDYLGCIQLLNDVPALRRTEGMEELLDSARKREDETELLLDDIKDCERRKNMDGIESLVKRMLKLKPGNIYAKRLWETLHTYSRLPASQRSYRFEKGRLQPMLEPGFLREWGVLTALCVIVGALVCLSIYSYTTNYLNSDEGTFEVESDSDVPAKPTETDNSPQITNSGIGGPTEPEKLFTTFDMTGLKAGDAGQFTDQQIRFRWCPAGTFTMGSPPNEPGRGTNERQVQVTLSTGFWLQETEVTQAQWRAVMATAPWTDLPKLPRWPKSLREGNEYPATVMNWEDANDYCDALTNGNHTQGGLPPEWKFRLPTEAEWEYACRAGTESAFSFGEDSSLLSDYAWCGSAVDSGLESEFAHPVGLKKPNQWGIHDMHGNVFEWCQDYEIAEAPGGIDPIVTGRPGGRTHRGGCYGRPPEHCRSATRSGTAASAVWPDVGFRIVLSTAILPGPPNSNRDGAVTKDSGSAQINDLNARLTIESQDVDFHTLRVTSLGIESVDNRYAIPEFTVNGHLWKPKEKSSLLFSEIPGFDSSAFNVANARVEQIEFGWYGDVRYEYSTDVIQLGMGHVPAGGTSFKFRIVSDPHQRSPENRLPEWAGEWDTAFFAFDKDRDGLPPDMAKVEAQGAVAREQVADLSQLNPKASEQIEAVLAEPFALTGVRRFQVEGGRYQIRTIADAGVRVFVDDKMVIDSWKLQPSTLTEKEVVLQPGTRTMRIEYFSDAWPRNLGLFMERVDTIPPSRSPAATVLPVPGTPAAANVPRSGLILHIDPSISEQVLKAGNVVRKVSDQSGRGNELTPRGAGQPVIFTTNAINGRSALTFENGQSLGPASSGDFANNNFTIFVVVHPTEFDAWNFVAGKDTYAYGNGYGIEFYQDELAAFAGQGPDQRHQSTSRNTTLVLSAAKDDSSIRLWVNGKDETSHTKIASFDPTVSEYRIGNSDNTAPLWGLTGHIGEVLHYNRNLSDAERKRVESLLMEKWLANGSRFIR